jgi:ribosomal protein S18 acetylase RimI-like enzyme
VYDRALSSENQKYLCAVENNKIVGFGSLTIKNNLWQEGNLGHIDEVVVDKSARGKGIGRQILSQLIALAKEKKCRRVELDTAFHRKGAHRFYEQHGFTICILSSIRFSAYFLMLTTVHQPLTIYYLPLITSHLLFSPTTPILTHSPFSY